MRSKPQTRQWGAASSLPENPGMILQFWRDLKGLVAAGGLELAVRSLDGSSNVSCEAEPILPAIISIGRSFQRSSPPIRC